MRPRMTLGRYVYLTLKGGYIVRVTPLQRPLRGLRITNGLFYVKVFQVVLKVVRLLA